MTSPKCSNHHIAFFSGSFDPFTRGHESIVRRTLAFVNEVVVAIGINPDKKPMLSVEARTKWIERVFANEPRVRVISYSGLTVDAAKSVGASCIVRGVRNAADLEYEQRMADYNRCASGIDTVLLFTLPDEKHISSTQVRNFIACNADLSEYLPSGAGELLPLLNGEK